MEWQFVLALVIAIPVILIPVALVWFLNIGGLAHVAQRRGKVVEKKTAREVVK